MVLTPFGGIKISREKPTISVRIVDDIEDLATAQLYLRRVGTYTNVVVYAPSNVVDGQVEFTLDELFFEEPPGRYLATFKINSIERSSFQLQYDDESIVSVFNKATP